MEKLVELLNEYIKEKKLGNTVKEIDDDFFVNNYNNWDGYLCEEVMSKKFGFIERLVKNDKIKWRDKTELYYNISCYDWDGGEYELIGPDFTDTEQIIMILSIQDNPIEYLCSILKE